MERQLRRSSRQLTTTATGHQQRLLSAVLLLTKNQNQDMRFRIHIGKENYPLFFKIIFIFLNFSLY